MGFTVYYRSPRPVGPAEVDSLQRAADEANRGRTWLSCEPVNFFDESDDGRLWGGSKPNFQPHPLDVASAAHSGLPDGTLRDLVEVLCRLSRDHGVDWEFRHDEAPWSVGSIRDGVADAELLGLIDALEGMADAIRESEGFGEDELA